MKPIQALRHAMTLGQEPEIKLKAYNDLNNDDPLVVHINTTPQNYQVGISIQSQDGEVGNSNFNLIRSNLKANLMYYKYGEKGHLIREYHHAGTTGNAQSKSIPA